MSSCLLVSLSPRLLVFCIVCDASCTSSIRSARTGTASQLLGAVARPGASRVSTFTSRRSMAAGRWPASFARPACRRRSLAAAGRSIRSRILRLQRLMSAVAAGRGSHVGRRCRRLRARGGAGRRRAECRRRPVSHRSVARAARSWLDRSAADESTPQIRHQQRPRARLVRAAHGLPAEKFTVIPPGVPPARGERRFARGAAARIAAAGRRAADRRRRPARAGEAREGPHLGGRPAARAARQSAAAHHRRRPAAAAARSSTPGWPATWITSNFSASAPTCGGSCRTSTCCGTASENRGQSIAILEAMAAGVPVIASDTPTESRARRRRRNRLPDPARHTRPAARPAPATPIESSPTPN